MSAMRIRSHIRFSKHIYLLSYPTYPDYSFSYPSKAKPMAVEGRNFVDRTGL